jgi:hypothetical protein
MKIAVALDGLLCDTETLKQEWYRREGDWKFLSDMAFWGALKPYDDVRNLELIARQNSLYVFAERPKAVFMPTRAWVRNNCGVQLNKDRLIMQAIKRYDCRILGIDVFVDSDPVALENLKVETVRPIRGYLCDRAGGQSLKDVLKEIDASLCS